MRQIGTGGVVILVFAAVVGFVSAGFVGSLWAVFAGERPQLALLGRRGPALPLAIAAVVLHMPMMLLETGLNRFWFHRPLGVPLIAFATLWCFLQGVFVLNKMFGLE